MTAVLYILMRNDLASMNPGKAMAQASHASNAFVDLVDRTIGELSGDHPSSPEGKLSIAINSAFNEWKNSTTQAFGTVIVLEGGMDAIRTTVSVMKKTGYVADVVHDPTYPLIDGSVLHLIPLDTCAYVFVHNREEDEFARFILSQFSLHR